MGKRRGSRFGRFGVLPLVVLLGVVAAGCGSPSSPSTAAKAPAGANENATAYTGTAVCYDLYKAGVQVPCAENTIGPGGGVIFYDAGSVQSWGRFLEAAPWKWNQLMSTWLACHGGCGADTSSVLKPVLDRTQDSGDQGYGSGDGGQFFRVCTDVDVKFTWVMDAAGLPMTGTAVGAGRENTRLLLQKTQPVPNSTAPPYASKCGKGQMGTMYDGMAAADVADRCRSGGLDDWYLPSKDELDLLYRFGNRDAIGGFEAGSVNSNSEFNTSRYVSSSIASGEEVWAQSFNSGKVSLDNVYRKTSQYFSVRPIRAFS